MEKEKGGMRRSAVAELIKRAAGMAVIPLICLGVFRLCGITGALLTAMIIAASAPPANITVVFAAKYNKDTGLASQTVAIVSFISIVTMPLLIGLASTM